MLDPRWVTRDNRKRADHRQGALMYSSALCSVQDFNPSVVQELRKLGFKLRAAVL